MATLKKKTSRTIKAIWCKQETHRKIKILASEMGLSLTDFMDLIANKSEVTKQGHKT